MTTRLAAIIATFISIMAAVVDGIKVPGDRIIGQTGSGQRKGRPKRWCAESLQVVSFLAKAPEPAMRVNLTTLHAVSL
jgi:hypothetical protein